MTDELNSIEAVRASQTSMLATLLTGMSVEQVVEAAALAGLVDADADGLLELLPSVATVKGSGGSSLTVKEFFHETVEGLARAASGDEKRGGGLNRTYLSYWRLMIEGYPFQHKGVRTKTGTRVGGDPVPEAEKLFADIGHMRVVDVRKKHLQEVLDWCVIRATLKLERDNVKREQKGRPVRHSNLDGARRNAVGAMRYFFKAAAEDHLIDDTLDPSRRVKKPGKAPSSRRAFTEAEYTEFWSALISGGDDPELDALLFETVFITGARREGLMNLDLRHLDFERVTLWLDEKNNKIAEQPATLDLLERLAAFAARRGSVHGDDPVFAFKRLDKNGRPRRITDRRFDTVHSRLQGAMPWAAKLGVTVHFARHHAVTTVERIASEAVAARFARHSDGSVTRDYDKATGEEVCAAVAAMTGTTHPLAAGGW